MQRIERWFASAAEKQERMVTLYPCLLRNRLLPYFIFRLRYLFTLRVISFAVHVAEFLVLLSYAPKLAVIIVVVLRAGSPLVRGAWWGAMEVLREKLRDLSGHRHKTEAEQAIANWLVLSVILAALVMLAGLAWLTWSLSQASASDHVVDIYIVLIVAELALRIPVLTLHSGIYATRRVYRPLISILLPTLLQAAIIAALFGPLKEGSLIVAIIAGSGFSLVISYIYIKRMYEIVDLRPTLQQGLRHFGRFLAGLPVATLMWSTAAGFLIRIDSLLVLILVGLEDIAGNTIDLTAGHPEWNTPDLAVLLYIILPAIRGSYEWSILFYFDLVRLRRAIALHNLAHVFMAKLVFAAAIVGLFFWLLAAIVFVLGFQDIPIAFLVAMLPFFLVRSWLAVYQVRAYADHRYATVCISMIVILAGVVLIGTGELADIGSFAELKICFLISLIVLIIAQLWYDRREIKLAPLLSLGDWCKRLTHEPGEVTAGTLEIARSASDRDRLKLRDMLTESLEDSGHGAWRDKHCLVYFYRHGAEASNRFDPRTLLDEAAGLVNRLRSTGEIPVKGRRALAIMRERGLLPSEPDARLDTSGLVAAFQEMFESKGGLMIDLSSPSRAKLSADLDRETTSSAIPTAVRALGSGATSSLCGSYRLYPAFLDQKLHALFFVPGDTKPDVLNSWKERMNDWSLSQSKRDARDS
ncbi:MAG: hypothetical protein AAF563_20160 [Pseudomonadota bacterium]